MKKEKKQGRRSSCIVWVLFLIFAAGFIGSGYMVWKTSEGYRAERKVSDEMKLYNPAGNADVSYKSDNNVENPQLVEAGNINKDVCAWIRLDGTKIDYIVVKGSDNSEYLKKDIYGKYAAAGTLFEDYRCERDFSGLNSIIYGHNRKNDSMLGTLSRYEKQPFFESNKTGVLYLPQESYHLEVFAFLVLSSDDEVIYNPTLDGENLEEYMAYVKKNAVNYREMNIAPDDRILTLSTCSYSFEGARNILLAKIVP